MRTVSQHATAELLEQSGVLVRHGTRRAFCDPEETRERWTLTTHNLNGSTSTHGPLFNQTQAMVEACRYATNTDVEYITLIRTIEHGWVIPNPLGGPHG